MNWPVPFWPLQSSPFSRKRLVSIRLPATENAVQAPLLTFELGFDVLTLRTRRLSKLRPFSGRSLTCCSLINPEVEASVVLTSGASSLTVTCSALAPTSSVRSITASCPTARLIPSRTACLKPGMVVVISYGPTGSDGAVVVAGLAGQNSTREPAIDMFNANGHSRHQSSRRVPHDT